MKCECTDEIKKILKKRGLKGNDLAHAMALERGSDSWKPIPFNHPDGTLVNSANKLYSLRTELKNGGMFELCKAKGMSKGKFTFDNYVAMFDLDNPKPLTDPKQMQFRMGLSDYCTDGGIQPIRKVVVKKSAYARYDKGEVDPHTFEISPLTLGAGSPLTEPPTFMNGEDSDENLSEADLGDFDGPDQSDVEWDDGDVDSVCGMEDWDGPEV